jgi:protein SCO1/2
VSLRFLVAATCCWLAVASGALAHATADDLVQRAGFDQHLNRVVPLGLVFRDDDNRAVRLTDYFGSVPVVLAFSYYGCSNLCPTVIGNLADALRRSGLQPGTQYRVVVVSIDPGDSPSLAARSKAAYFRLDASDNPGREWHLLTGSGDTIAALTGAAGFRYVYDAATHQYAHPAGVLLLTPGGRIARYFFGFDFTAPQLRQAIEDASEERVASPAARLLLLCFHFDPAGKYSATVLQALRWIALAMLAAVLAWAAGRRRRGDAHRPAE